MSELRDWAGLPDGLLHSVITLLGSFPDLLTFAATCCSWRAAFSSFPSKSTFYTLFPPLLLQPNVPFCSPRPFPNVARNTFVPKRPCYVTDLASQDTLLCSHIPLLSIDYGNNCPPNALDKFAFRGASFGHMIFSWNRSCFVFDVFTGIDVSPPLLPVDEYTEIYYGAALTAPPSSPNSYLIVSTASSNFFWHVGSNSWLKRSPRSGALDKFVVFKGQVYGMGSDRRLFMVHLTPQIRLQKIPVSWGGRNSMTKWHFSTPWLVVCGDMLLMVGCRNCFPGTGDVFEAYRLDTSTEPAKWVKVEKLENWAIFISMDERVQPLSCMNPERWGGRSNCVYCYDSGHLVPFELGKPLQGDAIKPDVFIFICCGSMVQPIWMVPSMFSLC
ncbi:unnamed protein product [Urochloa decumbens]|uniref:KIB1-4 beta-propeller domain-containing protein n=1 Tax=Urochloa decumbens TaxID=240449 RepID=A0ABC9DTZ1_9POAL